MLLTLESKTRRMNLQYEGKKSEEEILAAIPPCKLIKQSEEERENMLIKGDNLMILKHLLLACNMEGTVDLVYIDPPFASQNTFTLSEKRANTISNQVNGKIAYADRLKGAEFLEFLRKRLILLRMLLSDQGSIYLHIDDKIGHYVKIIMDEVFGIENFRNDISRVKCNPKNFRRKGYGNIKDMVLFYSKTSRPIWNEPKFPYTEADIKRLFPKKDSSGRRYTTIPLHAPGETRHGKTAKRFKGIAPPVGRHWRTDVAILEQWDEQGLIEWSKNGVPRKKIFAAEQEGKRVQDIWELKDPQYPVYPTEKNAQLLELIIKTSSNPGSIVLDCFCGSGTTLTVARRLERKWIGVDESEPAIQATRQKLGTEIDYTYYSF